MLPRLFGFLKSIKSSLTRKLVAVSLVATLVPLLSWSVFFYDYSMKNVESEYLNSIANNITQLKYNLASQVNTCKQIAQSYAGDNHLVDFLQYGTETDYAMVNILNNNILTRLRTVLIYNRNFLTARLIHGNPRIPPVYDLLYYDRKFEESWWPAYLSSLGSIAGQGGYFVNLKHREDVYMELTFGEARNAEVFSFYYPIYSTYSLNELLGVFEISIRDEVFFQPLMEQKLAKGVVLEAVMPDGRAVFSTGEGFAGLAAADIADRQDSSKAVLGGQEYFITKAYMPELGCWLIQYTPRDLLYQNNAYRTLILFGLLAVLLTTASISLLVFKLLLANLNSLTKTIHRIKQGDLQARVEVKSNDEVGELSREFNDMTEKIHALVSKVEASGRAEKEAVYNALENQISPHFICNALDTIRMTAEVQDNRPIADAIEMISSYFMYNITKRGKDVSIVDELKNVTDYLNIHNLIRKEKIEYVIDVAQELRSDLQRYRILKFSLQPVIENSVKHGFKAKRSKCMILLHVEMVGQSIRITVEDNGAGMDESRLGEIRAMLDRGAGAQPKGQESGIGLGNIRERFALSGHGCSMSIDSYEGVGTKVTIVIPAYEKGGSH